MRTSSSNNKLAFFYKISRFNPLKQAGPQPYVKPPYSGLRSDVSGFTLLEMMVAMVILMVGLLGMLTTINVALQQSTTDQLREIAVGIGEDEIRAVSREEGDSLLIATEETHRVTKPFRGYSAGFNVTQVKSPVTSKSAEIKVIVSWVQKGMTHTHELKTIRSN